MVLELPAAMVLKGDSWSVDVREESVKQGIALLPAPAHRIRLPCTLDMINYIVNRNTQAGASMSQVMLATGVQMGFFLCLRSSEYISKRVVPLVDTHQFCQLMSNLFSAMGSTR